MYKLVALDLDGTVLRSDKTISGYTIEVIRKLYKKGIKFILATGRMKASALQVAGSLVHITAGLVCCNGSYVYDMENQDVLLDKFISDNIALELVKEIKRSGRCYYVNLDSKRAVDKEMIFRIPEERRKGLLIIEDLIGTLEKSNFHVRKISVIKKDNEDIIELENKLKQVYGKETMITRTDKHVVEIVEKNCSKKKGLKLLADKFLIKADQIIAIGDNMNDYEMLSYAGLAIAMENGDDEVKKVATIVTNTNDENGAAVALDKIFR